MQKPVARKTQLTLGGGEDRINQRGHRWPSGMINGCGGCKMGIRDQIVEPDNADDCLEGMICQGLS